MENGDCYSAAFLNELRRMDPFLLVVCWSTADLLILQSSTRRAQDTAMVEGGAGAERGHGYFCLEVSNAGPCSLGKVRLHFGWLLLLLPVLVDSCVPSAAVCRVFSGDDG